MRRKVITILTFVFIACFVVLMFLVNKEEKYVWGSNYEYMMEDGQVVDTGDMKITLEKYYYDKEAIEGYCIFCIEENGKTADEIEWEYGWNIGIALGEDYPSAENDIKGKYRIEPLWETEKGTTGSFSQKIKEIRSNDGKKQIYYEFSFSGESSELNKILVLDKENTTNMYSYEYIGEFILEDTVKWREFTDGKNTIKVSCASLQINDGEDENISNLEVVMKDGTKHKIYKYVTKYHKRRLTGDMGIANYDNKKKFTRLVFKNMINPEDIKYISWEGKKYSTS